MVFQCINIRQVPWEVLKTEAPRYNCASSIHYDMLVGCLILEFALVSSFLLLLLQLVVPLMLVLWRCSRPFVLSRKRTSVLDSNRKHSLSISVTWSRERNVNPYEERENNSRKKKQQKKQQQKTGWFPTFIR